MPVKMELTYTDTSPDGHSTNLKVEIFPDTKPTPTEIQNAVMTLAAINAAHDKKFRDFMTENYMDDLMEQTIRLTVETVLKPKVGRKITSKNKDEIEHTVQNMLDAIFGPMAPKAVLGDSEDDDDTINTLKRLGRSPDEKDGPNKFHRPSFGGPSNFQGDRL